MQEEFGDDLAVIFVESQGASQQQAQAFAAKQKWLGGRAMWTVERPMSSGMNGLPSFVLLGNDGRVLLKGYSTMMHKEIEQAIEQQVVLRKKGPKDLPGPIAKVYEQINRGNYGQALTGAEKAIAEPPSKDKESFLTAAGAAQEAAKNGAEREALRVEWLIEHGYPDRARELAERLSKGFDGHASLEAKAKELKAKFDGDAMAAELSAAKSLVKLESTLHEKGPSKDLAIAFDKFAEEHKDTKVAGRARELAEVSRS